MSASPSLLEPTEIRRALCARRVRVSAAEAERIARDWAVLESFYADMTAFEDESSS
jgi:hypothetical protein